MWRVLVSFSHGRGRACRQASGSVRQVATPAFSWDADDAALFVARRGLNELFVVCEVV